MLQLYFLSILCNGLAGFLFVYGDALDDGSKSSPFGGGFRLVVGILSGVTGLLKLLAPVQVVVLGDLLPATAGIVAGFMLVYSFAFRRGPDSEAGGEGRMERIGDALLKYKKPIGFACIAVAVLHFLFPEALFL